MAEKTNGKIVDRNQEKVSIGMRYGALAVVGENTGEDRRWICRCDCGKVVYRNSRELKRKRYPSRSCGCQRKTRLEDLTGQQFHYLTVIERAENTKQGKTQWLCKCVCGKMVIVAASDLKKKRHPHKSCGCMGKKLAAEANSTHGMSKHPAFGVWHSMKQRCEDSNHPAFHNYGGRGITVCSRWQSSFENFWEDMGPTYRQGLDLDRIDNDKGYSPENCRWTSRKINCRNRRCSRYVDSVYGRRNVAELSEMTGIRENTLLYRLQIGFPTELLCIPPDTTSKIRWMAPFFEGKAIWLDKEKERCIETAIRKAVECMDSVEKHNGIKSV